MRLPATTRRESTAGQPQRAISFLRYRGAQAGSPHTPGRGSTSSAQGRKAQLRSARSHSSEGRRARGSTPTMRRLAYVVAALARGEGGTRESFAEDLFGNLGSRAGVAERRFDERRGAAR